MEICERANEYMNYLKLFLFLLAILLIGCDDQEFLPITKKQEQKAQESFEAFLNTPFSTNFAAFTDGRPYWQQGRFLINIPTEKQQVYGGIRAPYVDIYAGNNQYLGLAKRHMLHFIIAIRLDNRLLNNVPDKIKTELKKEAAGYDKELFFVIEEAPSTDIPQGCKLQALDWAFAKNENLYSLPNNVDMKRDLLMMLSGSDPYDLQLDVNEQLKTFAVHLHPQNGAPARSPDNAHILCKKNQEASFFSLIIDKKQRRAAVTLHWLVTKNDMNQLLEAFYKIKNLNDISRSNYVNLKDSLPTFKEWLSLLKTHFASSHFLSSLTRVFPVVNDL